MQNTEYIKHNLYSDSIITAQFDLSFVSLDGPADWTQLDRPTTCQIWTPLSAVVSNPPHIVIGPSQTGTEGILSEREGGWTYLPEQSEHELTDSSGSQTKFMHKFAGLDLRTCCFDKSYR